MKRISLIISLLLVATFALSADTEPTTKVRITGGDETADGADVVFTFGKWRLATDSVTVIDQIFGRDPHATSWFFFGTSPDEAEDADGIGSAGDTVRVQIPAAVSPIGTTLYPAVDVTTTVSAACVADANPERCVAIDVCTDLENDANFQAAQWNCIVIKDHSGVFIESKLFNEFGNRSSWTVTTTGTTSVVKAFLEIETRGLPTELSRSPNNPRQGILGIAGTVTSIPGGVGNIVLESFKSTSGESDMRVDGSTTPIAFRVECDPDDEKLINEVRIFGGCNGIKFGQFLCKNQPLTNGIEFSLRSEGNPLTFPFPIKRTEGLKNKFAFGVAGPGGNFRLDIQSGGDQLLAAFLFPQPAIIRKCGTAPTPDDFMQFLIRDNLTGSPGGNLDELEALVQGFRKEP